MVQLNPTLPPPDPADDTVGVNGNSDSTTINVLANDCAETGLSAADCDARRGELRLVGVSQPSHGVATIVDCNQVAYTPKPYFAGTDSFTYRVSNGSAEERTATVTVTVTGDSPVTVACGGPAVSSALTASDMKSLGRADYYCDSYYFNATAGKMVTLTLSSSAFYPLLIVKSPGGAIVGQNEGNPGTAASVSFTPREPALYIIEVSSADGQTSLVGSYNLSWACQEMWVKSGAAGLVSGDTLDFGVTANPGPVQLPVTIGNDGSANLTISGFGASPGDFKVSLNSGDTPVSGPLANFVISPGSSRTVYAYYTPSGTGDHVGSLDFSPSGLQSFHLSLKGHSNPVGNPPAVAIQSPVNNSQYVKPVIVRISATASADAGSTLSSVTFYARRTDESSFSEIASFTSLPLSSPFNVDWDVGAAGLLGDYQIAVVAQDNYGLVTVDSTVIHVSLTSEPNDPPHAEDDGRTFVVDSSANPIPVLANDTDSESDTLLITGYSQPKNGIVVLSGNAFTYTPNGEFTGSDSFSYIITDQHGGYSQAFVTINVVDPNVPSVAITAPVGGYSDDLPIPGGLTITAGATASGGATITTVKFYVDDELIGEDVTAAGGAYSIAWTRLTSGFHTLTAIANDDHGCTRKSDPVQIHLNPKPNNVPPVAAITSPTQPTSPLSDATDFAPTLVIHGDHLDVSGGRARWQSG